MTLTMNCPTESCITWNLQNFKYLSFQQFNTCNDFADLSSQTLVECDRIKEKNDSISWSEAKTYHIPSFTWRWVTFKKIIIINEEDWKNIQQRSVLQQEIFPSLVMVHELTLNHFEISLSLPSFSFSSFPFSSVLLEILQHKKYLCHPLSFSILSWQDLQFLIKVTHTLFFLSSTWWMMVFGCI